MASICAAIDVPDVDGWATSVSVSASEAEEALEDDDELCDKMELIFNA